ncbi:MAG: galactose mutarotase, partial [Rhodobacteraceae bacterium]|nr:galactose mutarotase [Paracoccaceae bacterium]
AYGPRAGLALETQEWPDAPNHADFPDPIIRPGEVYRNHVTYRFTRQG